MLKQSNKNGFGNAVGSITNRVTTMFDVLASLKKDSEEYNELMRRIICGQALQQEEIDKIKGIQAKPMPKEWYDYKVNKITEEDSLEEIKIKERNLKLMVNKKPYFFIYNYKPLQSKYNVFMKNVNNNCIIRFGLTYEELSLKEELTEAENQFLQSVKYKSPVFTNPSAMNRICWYIENTFKDVKLKVNKDDSDFDKHLYMTNNKKYTNKKDKVKSLFKDYKKKQQEYLNSCGLDITKEEKKLNREIFIEGFRQEANEIYSNSEDLCNCLVDLLYDSKANRQFVWDMCGEQMITNLLNKNDNKYTYPVKCNDGDIEWDGIKFTMEECKVC